jgi:hypothetical protein
MRDERARLMADNEQLRREIQEIRVREKLAQKVEEEKLFNYKRRFEALAEAKQETSRSKVEDGEEREEESRAETARSKGNTISVKVSTFRDYPAEDFAEGEGIEQKR